MEIYHVASILGLDAIVFSLLLSSLNSVSRQIDSLLSVSEMH